MIYIALLGTISTLLLKLFLQAGVVQRRATLHATLQQQGLVLISSLRRDLCDTTLNGVSLSPTSTSLAIHRLSEGTFSGQPLWSDRWVCYGLDKSALFKDSAPGAPTAQATPMTPGAIVAFCSGPSSYRKILCPNVETLLFVPSGQTLECQCTLRNTNESTTLKLNLSEKYFLNIRQL